MRRAVATLLAFALVVTAPGLPAYHASAQMIRGTAVTPQAPVAPGVPVTGETAPLGIAVEAVQPLSNLSFSNLEEPGVLTNEAAPSRSSRSFARTAGEGARRADEGAVLKGVSLGAAVGQTATDMFR